MSNEELKKEAEAFKESKRHRCFRAGVETVNINYESYLNNLKQAYIAGAEPREKRIAELEKRLNDIELLCYTDGSDGEVLAKIMGYFAKENNE